MSPPSAISPAQPTDFLQSILDTNATYAHAFAQSDPALLAKLAAGQSPRICWLGCSDSRVSAELSTGVAPGSIFVHRNIAQCFHPEDASALAALTFAIHELKVEAIIVCGHTGCGGVRAAMVEATEELIAGGPLPHKTEGAKIISNWIEPIKTLALEQIAANAADSSAPSHPQHSVDPLSADSLATLTDVHVGATVKLLSQSNVVKEAWAQGMKLAIHGWVYHVATAKLRDLEIGIAGPNGETASAKGSPAATPGL